MKQEILNAILLSIGFLLLFGIAELLYHKAKVRAENTRKFAHISGGLITLLFPQALNNHWYVLILCTLFFVILFSSIQFGMLPSINAVQRSTIGSLLFPVAVYMCYLTFDQADHDFRYFYIPILILSISDSVAALAGKAWPIGKYRIGKHAKTLTGSLMFLLSAFIISLLLLNISETDVYGQPNAFYTAALIALTTTGMEAVCCKGYDNLTIPGITILTLMFTNLTI